MSGFTGRDARAPAILGALGAWTVAVPYLAVPVGARVDVPGRIEVVDHVVPGVLVLLCAAWLARGTAVGLAVLIASAVSALAGFWVLATHVPLLADAASGRESWFAALWHSVTAPLIVILGLRSGLRAGPAGPGGA